MAFLRAAALAVAAGGAWSRPLFSNSSYYQFQDQYWPQMQKLFIKEGDAQYPMPPSDKVPDLLSVLRDVKGIAVHTSPDVTVSEGQGYAMFAAGMSQDFETLKGLVVGWQASGQGLADTPACGGCGGGDPHEVCSGSVKSSCLCKSVPGAYMPGWDLPLTKATSLGSATDGDEDAIMGIIYLAELSDSDEVREYAVKSIAAFILEDLGYADPDRNSRQVPAVGDIPAYLQTMFLWRGGTCWGGFDTSSGNADRDLCINPAYFSPGEWRLFRDYLYKYPQFVPEPHTADDLGTVLYSAIVWGYNTLKRISCPNGLVSNWWTVPDKDWPWRGELKCSNSGTEAGAYYSDAARIPWRVALDYLWYGDEAYVPVYDEEGKEMGRWGPKEYSNRWAQAWKDLIEGKNAKGSYPPLDPAAEPIRKDQVLPLLSELQPCELCPKGFTCPPWNAWGSYAVAPVFQVPLDGVDEATMQEWTDFIAKVASEGCNTGQYFDLGQQIIVSQLLAGSAWLPIKETGAGGADGGAEEETTADVGATVASTTEVKKASTAAPSTTAVVETTAAETTSAETTAAETTAAETTSAETTARQTTAIPTTVAEATTKALSTPAVADTISTTAAATDDTTSAEEVGIEKTCDTASPERAGVNQECGGILPCCLDGCACETHGEYTQCVSIGDPNSLTCSVAPEAKYTVDDGEAVGGAGAGWVTLIGPSLLACFALATIALVELYIGLRRWTRHGLPRSYQTLARNRELALPGARQAGVLLPDAATA